MLIYNNNINEFLKQNNIQLMGVSKGLFKTFSEKRTVKELVDDLNLAEEKKSKIKTIHKVKGEEFESVLVYLEGIEELVNPNISQNEETRVLYVACSRAKRFLCIGIPEVSQNEKKKIEDLYGLIIN